MSPESIACANGQRKLQIIVQLPRWQHYQEDQNYKMRAFKKKWKSYIANFLNCGVDCFPVFLKYDSQA